MTGALLGFGLLQKETIESGQSMTIPSGYQLTMMEQLAIEGTLTVNGTLYILPDGIIN